MSKLTINSVHTKEQIYPMLLNFQNGYPNVDFKFDCVLIQDEDGNRVTVGEFYDLLYAGDEEKDLGRTFVLARNRKTGKARLIETGCAELKPVNKYTIQQLVKKKIEPDRLNHPLLETNQTEPELHQTDISQLQEPNELEPNFPKHPSKTSEVPDRPDHPLSLGTSDFESNTLSNYLSSTREKCHQMIENGDLNINILLLHQAQPNLESNRPICLTPSEDKLEPIRKNLKLKVNESETNQTELEPNISDPNTFSEHTQLPDMNDLTKENQSLESRTTLNKTNQAQHFRNHLERNGLICTQLLTSDLPTQNESEPNEINPSQHPCPKPAEGNCLYVQNKSNEQEPDKEPNKSLPHQTRESELNMIVSKNTPDTVEPNIEQEVTDVSEDINITTELNNSKYDHIMKYYHDELFATGENLKRKTEDHKQLDRIKNKDFSTVKEMLMKVLGLNSVGEKRKTQKYHTKNISVNKNKKNVHSNTIRNGHKQVKYDNDSQDTFSATYGILAFENKAYICRYCNNRFEDKGSLIFHLISHKFIRNTKNAVLKPLVKRIESIASGNNNKAIKVYSHKKKANEKKNYKLSQNADIIEVRNKNCLRMSDDNGTTTIQDGNEFVSGNLVISEDNDMKQKSYKAIEVKNVFENPKDDSPIHLQKIKNVLIHSQIDIERNFICEHCGKAFEGKGFLYFHLAAHKCMNDASLIELRIVTPADKTELNHEETANHEKSEIFDEKSRLISTEKIKLREDDIIRTNDGDVAPFIHESLKHPDIVGISEKASDLNNGDIGDERTTIREPHKTTGEVPVNHRHPKVLAGDNTSAATTVHGHLKVPSDDDIGAEATTINTHIKLPGDGDMGDIASEPTTIHQHLKVPGDGRICDDLTTIREALKIVGNREDIGDKANTIHDFLKNSVDYNIDAQVTTINEDPKDPDGKLVTPGQKEDEKHFTEDNSKYVTKANVISYQNQTASEGNYIFDHCEKTFEEKSPIIFHATRHNCVNEASVEVNVRTIANKTKDDHKKVETLCANIPVIQGDWENDKIKTREHKIIEESVMNIKESQSKKINNPENVSRQEWKDGETVCVHDPIASCKNDKNGKNKTDAIRKEIYATNRNASSNRVMTRRMVRIKDNENGTNSVSIKNEDTIDNTFICNDCGRRLKSKALLITHMNDHSKTPSNAKEKGFLLKYPPTNSGDWRLSNHDIKRKESKTTYKYCAHCDYKTSYSSRLIRHMNKHSKRHKCDYCEKDFQNIYNLKRHIRIHTGDKPFQCEVCNAKFAQTSSLNHHSKSHTKKRPFQCTVCSSKFKLKSGLNRHLNIHTKEKNYKCGTCSSGFSDVSSLKRHMSCHREKSYKCDICEYSTANSLELKKHIDAHANRFSKFKCPSCDFSTERGWSLKLHMTRHTGQKPYSCDRCEYSTPRSSDLKRHQNKHK